MSVSTQVERRERTRTSAARVGRRHLSRYGYGNLKLEQVARDAGYTRGALYHQFSDKDDLVLAVLAWVDETWREEAARLIEPGLDALPRSSWRSLEPMRSTAAVTSPASRWHSGSSSQARTIPSAARSSACPRPGFAERCA